MKRFIRLAGFLLFLLTGHAAAQADQEPLSLAQCLQLAEANSPTADAIKARLHAAAAQVTQARTLPNPIFTYTAQDLGLYNQGTPLLLHQETLSFQPLFAFARVKEAHMARENLRRSEALAEDERRQLRQAVGRAYHELLLAERLAAVEEQAVQVAAQIVAQNRQRVTHGDAGPPELARAQAEEIDARRTAELAKRRQLILQLSLSILIGAESPQPVRIVEEWSGGLPLLSPELRGLLAQADADRTIDKVRPALRELALSRRPDLRQAAAEIHQAEEQKRFEARRTVPLSDLQVGLAARTTAVGTGALVSVSMPVPLFDWNQGPRARAEAQLESARAARLRTERQILLEVDSALIDWQYTHDLLDRLVRPQVETRVLLLEAARRQFAAGVVQLIDVVTAHRDLLAARRDAARAECDAALSLWQLAMALAVL